MATDFKTLMNRVSAGDSTAADQLVREFEPEIRRAIRFRLRSQQLRRIVDSTDICQSVFARFFFSAALGQFDLESPQDLIRLLTRMATNRVIDRYRKEQSQKKLVEAKSGEQDLAQFGEFVDRGELAETEVEYAELLVRVRQRLNDKEQRVSRLRTEGKTWLEISQAMGESPQALRKQLERACYRIFQELGLDEI